MNNNEWRGLLLAALVFFLAGCGRLQKGSPEPAIRQAIEQHLAGREGLASNQIIMDIKKVEVQGNKAEADVVFRSRRDAKAYMSFHYRLHTEGNQWIVEGGQPGGQASPHPPTVPPSEPSEGAPPLPQGHPPTKQ